MTATRTTAAIHCEQQSQQQEPMNDPDEEIKFMEWAEPLVELAEQDGTGAAFQVLQSEREQLKALTDDVYHLCAESLDGRTTEKPLNQLPKSVLKAKVANAMPTTTTTVIKGTRGARKAPTTTASKATKHKYFHENVHIPVIGQIDDVDEEDKLRIECVDGPSKGQVWVVEPMLEGKKSGEVKIGRSTGKAFKTFGLSLPKDDEISTSHGSIFRRNNLIYYKDMNSSNGTAVVLSSGSQSSIQLEPLKAYKVINGMQVKMGQHTFQLNF